MTYFCVFIFQTLIIILLYVVYIYNMSAGSGASNLGYGNVAPLSNINGSYVNVDNSQYAGRFSSNEIPGTPPGPLPGLAGTKSNIDAAAGIFPGSRSFNGGAKKLKRKIKNITKHYKRMKAGSRKLKSIRNKLRKSASRRMSRSLSGGRKSRRRHISRRMSRTLSGGVEPEDDGFPSFPRQPGESQPENQIQPRSSSNLEQRETSQWMSPDLRNMPANQGMSANQGGRRRRRQRGGYSQYQNNLPYTPTYQVAGINLPASQLGLANPPPYVKLSGCVNCVDNYNHYTNMGFPSKGH